MKKTYYGIDWLRAIACIGIVLMHIRANNSYDISGWIYNKFVPSLTDFVYLFMAISAFGMCCGYFEKVIEGRICWTDFYKKRYLKIFPFFAFMVLLDIVVSRNITSIIEGITELTLLHGFIPQELSVIGVAWYLGTVFVFYLVFPFFCVLIETKKRAWFSFGISVLLHYICMYYFDLGRHNFLFSLCFFILGGLIYRYKDELSKIRIYYYAPLLIITLFIYYRFSTYGIALILLVFFMLSMAISYDYKSNRVASFISGLSLEIYLSHMFVFRIIEKLHLNSFLGSGWVQYLITTMLVLIGAICFSYVLNVFIIGLERKELNS